MSQRTVYRSGVKHFLVGSFKWDEERAKSYVYININKLDELRYEGLSTFQAAKLIAKQHAK